MNEETINGEGTVCTYPDPETGYPPKYARDSIPKIAGYANGQTAPTPKGLGFKPGELVGSVSGELGLRSYLEKLGHKLIVTSDKDGDSSEFDKHLPDAEVVISQPFWPAYLTSERIAKARKLKLALTAGIGSDHVDLQAAARNNITVAEVTGSKAPKDHPWRTMPYNGMTAHISGTSLSAQTRYAAGTLEILQNYFEGTPIREEYLIVDGGALQALERNRTSWRDSD